MLAGPGLQVARGWVCEGKLSYLTPARRRTSQARRLAHRRPLAVRGGGARLCPERRAFSSVELGRRFIRTAVNTRECVNAELQLTSHPRNCGKRTIHGTSSIMNNCDPVAPAQGYPVSGRQKPLQRRAGDLSSDP